MLVKKFLSALIFLGYTIAFIVLLWRKKILLFLHPDFLILAYFAMGALAVIVLLLILNHKKHHHAYVWQFWRVFLLLLPLVCIFVVDLKPLSSSAALDRGINSGALTIGRRVTTNQFATKPENRSLYQWVIALSVDPEPSHYDGQAVHIKGFILHDPQLPQDQVSVARFIVTCCAADARVLSLPVKTTLPELVNLANDEWVEVEGKMQVIGQEDKRSLVVVPSKVTHIAVPDDPYEL